jgi:hypothetical protein
MALFENAEQRYKADEADMLMIKETLHHSLFFGEVTEQSEG